MICIYHTYFTDSYLLFQSRFSPILRPFLCPTKVLFLWHTSALVKKKQPYESITFGKSDNYFHSFWQLFRNPRCGSILMRIKKEELQRIWKTKINLTKFFSFKGQFSYSEVCIHPRQLFFTKDLFFELDRMCCVVLRADQKMVFTVW